MPYPIQTIQELRCAVNRFLVEQVNAGKTPQQAGAIAREISESVIEAMSPILTDAVNQGAFDGEASHV